MTIPVSVATNHVTLSVGVSNDVNIPVKCGVGIYSADYPVYEGSYEFTPSDVVQTVSIRNMIAEEDIVINPIPQNYGLITWNGSVLTVS